MALSGDYVYSRRMGWERRGGDWVGWGGTWGSGTWSNERGGGWGGQFRLCVAGLTTANAQLKVGRASFPPLL